MKWFPRQVRVLALVVAAGSSAVFAADAPENTWRQLHSTDFSRFAANLRTAGFPEETIGLLISQDVTRRFEERERALQPSVHSAEELRSFWTPERREAWLQLRKEKNELLRSVLGIAPDVVAATDWVAANYPRLSRSDCDTIRMITEDYDQLLQRVLTQSRGHLTDFDRETIGFLEAERVQDLGRLLSAAEVIDYQIKRSRFGTFVRHQLQCFDPSPAELQTYYQLGVKHGLHLLAFGHRMGQNPEIQQAVDAELAALWSAERVATLKRARHPHYQTTFKLVDHLALPVAVADQIFDSHRQLDEDLRSMSSRRPAPVRIAVAPGERPDITAIQAQRSAERKEALTGFLDRHLAVVLSLLGETGLAEYREVNRNWIERIAAGTVVVFSFN